ncbi:MAG: hypothetical protein GXO88_06465 [Chlorobi bacterium]|nr:hypothetical protein [Chlorobiota bacterium]
MDIYKLNLIGAYSAIFVLLTGNLIFVFRLLNQQLAEYWAGIAFMATIIPLAYLLYTSSQYGRSNMYIIQLVTMMGFIIVELLLDYVFKVDFRHTRWTVILYVMFFFAGTGGMIGIAFQAGKSWGILSTLLFLLLSVLAFVQHSKTAL